ncbi:nitroreductase family protein [Rhizobium sp. RU36D]|uniref:nitroreductase family protein n=1 Tax=Rhizobium sp. RU36D TaxID=1907415 RepID=UPI0009D8FD42|nr:nitroreductase family protein [Rhizobium sp. RU36D]SMD20164.1 Nitroreductase [Rhizobium sp. RU36D]
MAGIISKYLRSKPKLVWLKRRIRAWHIALALFRHDLVRSVQLNDWYSAPLSYGARSAQLLFWFHKLEKGLSINPQNPRFFGAEAASETCSKLRSWREEGLSLRDPVYLGAIEALRSYRTRLSITPPSSDLADSLIADIDAVLDGAATTESLRTPIKYHAGSDEVDIQTLEKLQIRRRSVRDFESTPVRIEIVERALASAILSPSACNRQPWRMHFYARREDIDGLLAFQNGNRGFGHTVPLLAVVAFDASSFFDATERSEGFLDTGLFLMSFLLALEAQGLSSCCLNWCVTPQTDMSARKIAKIPDSHTIVTLLAIGVAAGDAVVPASPRRSINDISSWQC